MLAISKNGSLYFYCLESTLSMTPLIPQLWLTKPNMQTGIFRCVLNSSSPTFQRPYVNLPGNSSYHYYSVRIGIQASGLYNIYSQFSTIKMFACLYIRDFNATSTFTNIITCDDTTGRNSEFFLSQDLIPANYTLIVTTSQPSQTAVFYVFIAGPRSIIFDRL